jgi:hypothetical protein
MFSFALVQTAYAQGGTPPPLSVTPFLAKINQYILNPIILLLFAVAFLLFLWGVFQFVRQADNPKAREEGQKNIMWGIVGMFIMFGVYGIIAIVLSTIGVNVNTIFLSI